MAKKTTKKSTALAKRKVGRPLVEIKAIKTELKSVRKDLNEIEADAESNAKFAEQKIQNLTYENNYLRGSLEINRQANRRSEQTIETLHKTVESLGSLLDNANRVINASNNAEIMRLSSESEEERQKNG
jgi:hypothetical protein